MENYYQLFNLNPQASDEDICAALRKQKKTWVSRQNAADPQRRAKADALVPVIDNALVIFSDKAKRKEYDKKLAKENRRSGGAQANTQAQTVEQPYGGTGGGMPQNNLEVILQQIRNVYDSGNTDATIQMCQRYLNNGIENSEIYKYMGWAYSDSGDIRMAAAEYKNGLLLNPDDHEFDVYLAALYLFNSSDASQADQYLSKAMEAMPNNSYVISLYAYRLMLDGKFDEVDDLVDQHLTQYPDDNEYRRNLSNVYLRYSDRYLSTGANGAYFINSEQDYTNRLTMLKKAQYILKDNGEIPDLKEMTDLGNKKLYTDDGSWFAYVIIFFVAFILISVVFESGFNGQSVVFFLLGIATAGGGAYLVRCNILPKWKLQKMYVTGKRETACSVAYWIGQISKWALFILGIVITIFMAAFAGSSRY